MSERPVLTLERVSLRDRRGPGGAARGGLRDCNLSLGSGLFAVLGTPEDGSYALLDLISGAQRPQSGKIALLGADPAREPGLRARLGMVTPNAELPAAPNVAAALRLAMAGWSRPTAASDVLALVGLTALHERPLVGLGLAERRGVELSLALAHPNPACIVVWEPFANLPNDNRALVVAQLEARAQDALVLAMISSPADAETFGQVLALHRGSFVRETRGAGTLGQPRAGHLVVWCDAGARSLAARLTGNPAVAFLSLSEPSAESCALLHLSGPDVAALAQGLAEAVRDSGAHVLGVRPAPPVLDEVVALSDWEQRARYETQRFLLQQAAQQRAAAMGPPRPPVHSSASLGPQEPPGPFGAPRLAETPKEPV